MKNLTTIQDPPDFLYARKVKTGTKLFEKLLPFVIVSTWNPSSYWKKPNSLFIRRKNGDLKKAFKPIFFPCQHFLLKALTLTLTVLLFYFLRSSAGKKEITTTLRVFLFTFFTMNLVFIVSVLVPSHFEALLCIFSLTNHTSKFFQQSLRPYM